MPPMWNSTIVTGMSASRPIPTVSRNTIHAKLLTV